MFQRFNSEYWYYLAFFLNFEWVDSSYKKRIYLSSIAKQIINSALIDIMTMVATLIHSVTSVTYTAVAPLEILTCTVAADRQA